MDRENLRSLIKARLQVNGFLNFSKQTKEQIQTSVNETERILHDVIKV